MLFILQRNPNITYGCKIIFHAIFNLGFGNTSLMVAPSQPSGASHMNISLPVASRDDNTQGIMKFNIYIYIYIYIYNI